MSGSYDRPTGHPTIYPTGAEADDLYATPASATASGPPPFTGGRAARAQLQADKPSHTSRSRVARAPASAPIVPAGSVTGRSLTLVITIMCFLACLTAGSVYMMNQSASA